MNANELMEDAMETAGAVAGGVVSAGVGYVAADALDRLISTHNPSGSTPPTDKFTSTGSGTLANVLNQSSTVSAPLRAVAALAATAIPAAAATVVDDPMSKAALEGVAIGAGVSLLSKLWSNVVMPMLIGTDTSTPALQKSVVARLYPGPVAAHINMRASPPLQQNLSSAGGALSGGCYPQLGAGDESPYDDVEQALAHGLRGDSPYDTTSQAIRHAAGLRGSSPYPDVAQTFMGADPVSVAPPAPPPTTVAPPSVVAATAAKVADTVAASLPGLSPAQAKNAANHAVAVAPAHVETALATALPHVASAHIQELAKRVHPHVARLHGQPTWQPGPPAGVGPGPHPSQPSESQCGCGSPSDFVFLGDQEDSEPLFGGIGDLVAEIQRKLDPAGHRSNGKSNGKGW